MPTFNQLVKQGRQVSVKKSTAPALQRGWNSEQESHRYLFSAEARRVHGC